MATRDSSFEGTNTSTTTANPLTSFGIWVAVRVRPFNKMELGDKDVEAPQPVIEMESDHKTLTLLDPTANYRERSTFTFDYCFSPFAPSIVLGDTARTTKDDSSDDEEASAERTQAEIYQAMGSPIVDSAWQGYNSCIFAYGQTSSGKSYTMMGTKRDPGIIPRLCRDLFERVETDRTNSNSEPGRKMIKVSLSYMEIYNERVKDLLKPKPKDARRQYKSRFETAAIDDDYQALRVRQHPLQGPFVEGLIRVDVENWLECVKYIRQGNELRSQCATDMNDSSSRSHAIFQLVVTQTEALGAKVRGKEVVNHKISKINLVDLAGSERITKTNVTGKHITEANHINQSLSTLRKVIDALVAKKKAGQTVIVPYRESLLTWILADNFGGNSKTAMIANVSPHHGNFLESESTLRYATLAKGIVNRARVNEDPSAKLIRELQAQLRQLQVELGKGAHEGHVRDLEDQMEENKKAMEELLAREEGMRVLIQESREREEQLRVEKETLERDQRHWRTEAERLRREKEELSAQLQRIVANDPTAATTTTAAPASTVPTLTKSGSRSVLKKSNTNFWMEGDGGDTNPESTDAPIDDASSCPPHQSQLIKRRRSTSKLTAQDAQLPDFLMSDSVIKPTTGEGDDKAKADDAKSDDATSAKNSTIQPKKRANRAPPPWVVEDAPLASEPAKPSDAAVAPAPAEPTTVSTPTPEVRHGRRAATEQGERDRSTVHESTEQVRTAGAGRRRGGEVVNISLSNSPTPGQVPPSLAHLVAPTTTASPAIAKQPAGPDALDSFLNGSTAPVQRERGKPWKQRRTPSQTSSPAVL